jgi:DNA-nicking Smr family endonuclease
MRRIRALTEAERQLWNEVARSVRPTPRAPPISAKGDDSPKADQPPGQDAPPESAKSDVPRPPPPKRPAEEPSNAPPLAPIERRLRQRLARGQRAVDAKIDLHGMRQAEAFAALLSFLDRAQRQGASMVLVVTGKGGRRLSGPVERRVPQDGGWEGDYGVLRRMVPLWLADPAARRLVIGFEEASPVHGGSGALYVRVRRG